jgi:hypothetical protein
VRFWISPQGVDAVLHWLDSKHTAEVAAQPGFLSAHRVRLEEDAADGWHAHMMIYGLESREALMRYFASDAPKRFAEERKPFEHHLRTERAWGSVDFKVG